MHVQSTLQELADRAPELLAPSLAQDWPELPVVRADGAYLHTADGAAVLDFTSGVGVTNTGHCHPRVIEAARHQMDLMIHSALGITLHESALMLAQELPRVMPQGMEMFFFGNSGAEAVEGALKLARYVTGRPGVISFVGGFHGRTYGAASVTTVKAKYRLHYEPFVGGVYFAPFADPYHGVSGNFGDSAADAALSALRSLLERTIDPSQVAAILVEPIQGEAGYIVPPSTFLEGLREICDEHGILLIVDEVQTGFGRTGDMFASMGFGVRPDVMAIGKGIASGFPLSATVASRDVMSRWKPGSHGTTYGGNPVSCAAALATLEVIRDEDLLANCKRQGERLITGLRDLGRRCRSIGDVRGRGLMVAIEFVRDRDPGRRDPQTARRFLDACLNRGLLLYMAGVEGETIRLIPPLIITERQIDEALSVMAMSLDEIER